MIVLAYISAVCYICSFSIVLDIYEVGDLIYTLIYLFNILFAFIYILCYHFGSHFNFFVTFTSITKTSCILHGYIPASTCHPTIVQVQVFHV